jgi:hypothetical protein
MKALDENIAICGLSNKLDLPIVLLLDNQVLKN